MALPPDKRELPVQDIQFRDPEWEELVRGDPTSVSEGRQVFWDPIHGWFYQTGPTIQIKPPLRPY